MISSFYTLEECEKIAEQASLRYVKDTDPGYQRKRCGKGFAYYESGGSKLVNPRILKRIRALAVPPAYRNVWICRYENGHIQATGWDDRGRKQYIYHPLWRQMRDQQKFSSMISFGENLSLIRRKIKSELKKPPLLNKSQVISAIIYLLDNTHVRIGNPFYARQNQSYGVTTLRKKHLKVKKGKVIFNFMGKNAQLWKIVLTDKHLIKLIKKCEEIPGYEIFKYRDELGNSGMITSQDVNHYLQTLTGSPFTAKDFRTWIACRETFCRLLNKNYKKSLSLKQKLKETIKDVAKELGHTPTICQKSYIDPDIINAWLDGRLERWREQNQPLVKGSNKDKLFLRWLQEAKKVGADS